MKIARGISDKNIEELIWAANHDELIIRNTSDAKRFKDKKAFGEWLKKGRIIYTWVGEKGELLGITWFGAEGGGFTLAIRLYGEARGKGYGAEFLKKCIVKFKKEPEYREAEEKMIWLETNSDNLAAIKTYEKVGFLKISSEGKRVRMELAVF